MWHACEHQLHPQLLLFLSESNGVIPSDSSGVVHALLVLSGLGPSTAPLHYATKQPGFPVLIINFPMGLGVSECLHLLLA